MIRLLSDNDIDVLFFQCSLFNDVWIFDTQTSSWTLRNDLFAEGKPAPREVLFVDESYYEVVVILLRELLR